MDGMKRTRIAQEGVDLATVFTAKFAATDLGGYRPAIREPTESTAGGKQALQHLVLEPARAGEPVITVGSVNVATKSAKLRTYECLRQLHQLRFGTARFRLRLQPYQDFMERARKLFELQGLLLELVSTPPAEQLARPATARPATTSTRWQWLLLLLVLAAAGWLGYLLYTQSIRL